MNQEILEVKRALIDGMIEYMKCRGAVDENDPEYDPEFDAGYMQEQVDRCSEIIDDFLASSLGDRQATRFLIKPIDTGFMRRSRIINDPAYTHCRRR
jgi:hypothetical protein